MTYFLSRIKIMLTYRCSSCDGILWPRQDIFGKCEPVISRKSISVETTGYTHRKCLPPCAHVYGNLSTLKEGKN